jgi:hypothetical protein
MTAKSFIRGLKAAKKAFFAKPTTPPSRISAKHALVGAALIAVVLTLCWLLSFILAPKIVGAIGAAGILSVIASLKADANAQALSKLAKRQMSDASDPDFEEWKKKRAARRTSDVS